jgi:hypothetical protein
MAPFDALPRTRGRNPRLEGRFPANYATPAKFNALLGPGGNGGGGGGGGGNGMGQCPANDNGYGCQVAGTADLGGYTRCTYNCVAMDGTKQTISTRVQGGPSGCYDPNNFPMGYGPPILPRK